MGGAVCVSPRVLKGHSLPEPQGIFSPRVRENLSICFEISTVAKIEILSSNKQAAISKERPRNSKTLKKKSWVDADILGISFSFQGLKITINHTEHF